MYGVSRVRVFYWPCSGSRCGVRVQCARCLALYFSLLQRVWGCLASCMYANGAQCLDIAIGERVPRPQALSVAVSKIILIMVIVTCWYAITIVFLYMYIYGEL